MKMFNALKVTVYFGIKYSKDKGASWEFNVQDLMFIICVTKFHRWSWK